MVLSGDLTLLLLHLVLNSNIYYVLVLRCRLMRIRRHCISSFFLDKALRQLMYSYMRGARCQLEWHRYYNLHFVSQNGAVLCVPPVPNRVAFGF